MALGQGEHLDPTGELTLETVKSRAVRGIFTLTGRTFFLQAIAFVAFIFFGVFLNSEEYGVYILLSAVVNFFVYFSDIGLAGALIQKKDKVTQEDLRTTFTIQQALIVTLLAVVFFLTPVFQKWYGLSLEGVYLIWALAISLFLSSLKTIPSVLLERRLEFGKLVLPQIVEAVLFNTVAVYLAWKGFGITSFAIAVLVRGISGLVLIYILQPWVPGIMVAKDSLKSLLRFGLPYQANTFLAVLKDDGLTMVLGGILGTGGIGLLGWAKKWADAPLRFFMDQVIKVTFPAFSRMQGNSEELSRMVSKSIFFVSFWVFPSLLGLILLSPLLTEVVPRYEKWQPALLALAIFGINSAWAAVATPLTNLLNGIGKIAITFKLMIMWTTLTWLFVPGLAFLYGVNGAAVGTAIVGTSSIVAIFLIRRQVDFDLVGSVGKPLLASVVMGIVISLLRSILPLSWVAIVVLILAGIFVYTLSVLMLAGPSLVHDARRMIYAIKTKQE